MAYDYTSLIDMRNRKTLLVLGYVACTLLIIISLKQDVNNLTRERDALLSHYVDHLQSALYKKDVMLHHISQVRKLPQDIETLPTIYAITPTYYRAVQKAELTRLSQTLALVPNIHWIIVEDADATTSLVKNLLKESLVANYTLLAARTPTKTKHRGVEQRNAGLRWLRNNIPLNTKGVVYFMDDDNTYSIKVFQEMSKIRRVGIWPVGLVGGLNAETPILDPSTGKVTGYNTGWKPQRPFAVDMAGFAISLELILSQKNAEFSYRMTGGLLESEFLSFFVTKEDLEPLADNCTKVYVWHTRTEKPVIKGTIDGLEV